MTVYEKILNVMNEVGYLNKDGFVETGKGKGYKALTDEKVLTAIRPVMVKHRLIMVPVAMEHRRADEKVKDYNGNEKTNRITDVDMTFRIINVDDPKDYVDVVSSGTGVDTQDKGIGKSMTYAKKYALLNSFLIPSGEDTDQISSEKYTEQLMGTPAPQPAEPVQPAQPTGDRNITIKTLITLAAKYGKASVINENGYNGRAWDSLTDDELVKLKMWLIAIGKKAS